MTAGARPPLLRTLRADLDAMNGDPLTRRRLGVVLRLAVHPRFRTVALFRLSQFLFVRRPLRFLGLLVSARILRLAGAELSPAARIGPRLKFMHTTGIVIGPEVRAGWGLSLHQGVTLGDRRPGQGQPRVGDRVSIGAGALVLGPVRIGDDARIGAGALVVRDVAPGAVVRAPSTQGPADNQYSG